MQATAVQRAVQLRNILFLTDFSAIAARAGGYAAALAKSENARLVALHVGPAAVNPMAPEWDPYHMEQAARAHDEEEKNQLTEAFAGLNAKIEIAHGPLWENVHKIIKRDEIDLIVMGTHGRSGASRLLFGSAAEEIFRLASCPVLTIGPHVPAIKSGAEVDRILLATDFSPRSHAATECAFALAKEHQAHLTLLHVLPEPQACDLVQPSNLAPTAEQALRNLVTAESEKWHVSEIALERGDAARKILELAARGNSSLIVMGVRREMGFPGAATHLPVSVAHEVVAHANCPVLTVRA